MNVARHLYSRQHLTVSIGNYTLNTESALSNLDTIDCCLNHVDGRRPILQCAYPIMTQSAVASTSYPIRVFPMTHKKYRDNIFPFSKPIPDLSFQRFTYRHHFAASRPIVNSVHQGRQFEAKQVRKLLLANYGTNYRQQHPSVPGKHFPENMVKVEFMHSVEEIQIYRRQHNLVSEETSIKSTSTDDDDNAGAPGIFRVQWNQSSILHVVQDYYGEDYVGQLEYYNYETNSWKQFPNDIRNNLEMVKLYKGKGNRTMPLRIQSDFDDGHRETLNTERAEADAVRIIVHHVVNTLRRERYVRISDTTLGRRHHQTTDTEPMLPILNSENGDSVALLVDNNKKDIKRLRKENNDDARIIPTKQWIIEQAEKDEFLASLLLSRPGALNHLIQCIHWDRVWK